MRVGRAASWGRYRAGAGGEAAVVVAAGVGADVWTAYEMLLVPFLVLCCDSGGAASAVHRGMGLRSLPGFLGTEFNSVWWSRP